LSTIQHYLFKRSLEEENIPIKNFRIDHSTPHNYNNDVKYNFVFPKSFISEVEKIDTTTKPIDYYFVGTIKGGHRQFLKSWSKDNSIIKETSQNNFIHPNNDPTGYYGDNYFNKDYFNELSKSKFSLCPAGCSAFDKKYVDDQKFMWTYRFWESILVGCIPITDEPDPKWHMDYKFYGLNDNHIYRTDWVEHNLKLLKKRHFIWTKD
jgi:hypothetical protein